MKLGSDYLATGKLAPAETQRFGDYVKEQDHPYADIVLKVAFAFTSERRKAGEAGDEKQREDALRALYYGKVVGWNVEGVEFSDVSVPRLVDADRRFEDFIIHEVNALSRFLG